MAKSDSVLAGVVLSIGKLEKLGTQKAMSDHWYEWPWPAEEGASQGHEVSGE